MKNVEHREWSESHKWDHIKNMHPKIETTINNATKILHQKPPLVGLGPLVLGVGVVYFNQQMGALLSVCWSKSFVSLLKQVFHFFPSLTEKRKKKERKAQK